MKSNELRSSLPRGLWFFILLGLPLMVKAGSDSIYLNVRILSNKTLHQLHITPVQGDYKLVDQGVVIGELRVNSGLQASVQGKKVRISGQAGKLGSYDTLRLLRSGSKGMLKLGTGKDGRKYDDDLMLYISAGSLLVINRVGLENYTAGVVEAEAGWGHPLEFYKIQCLISRTYALRNIRKHEQEAYQLCDQVHCQLYRGHSVKPEIMEALEATRGLVILSQDTQLISAAFHSNSGGQTCNSEDVWTLPSTYLKAIDDSFSLGMPMARWEKSIPKTKWVNHLKNKYDFPFHDPLKADSAFHFTQLQRRHFYVHNIPLKELRNDFKLRSTFFDVVDKGDHLLLKGRGYGHGVGLSQEGAIRMARQGYRWEDILHFYYRDIHVAEVDTALIPRKKPLPPQPVQ